MTPKERILAAITGKEVDRVPWSPFLAFFWDFIPQEVKDKGMLSFLEDMGADPLIRGSHRLFKTYWKKCSVREIINGNEKLITYETPVGSLTMRRIFTPEGRTWFYTGHPVKNEEDFKILAYLNEDMQMEPDWEGFIQDHNELGERGLYVPLIGTYAKTSFQALLETWVGTEELVYALADYPDTVEECLHAMRRNSIATAEICMQSPAEAFIFWEDSSTTNISPAYFDKYTAPEISAWSQILHGAGKFLIHHACGHLRGLLDSMSKTGIDMIESISPPPTGNIELWEARERLPGHIGLIGGIEPTVFLNSTMEELEQYITILLEKMGTKRYILSNSDSCPPGVSMEKFKLVTELIRRKG